MAERCFFFGPREQLFPWIPREKISNHGYGIEKKLSWGSIFLPAFQAFTLFPRWDRRGQYLSHIEFILIIMNTNAQPLPLWYELLVVKIPRQIKFKSSHPRDWCPLGTEVKRPWYACLPASVQDIGMDPRHLSETPR